MICKIFKWEFKKPIIYIKPGIDVLEYLNDNTFILFKIKGTDTQYDDVIMTGEVVKSYIEGVYIIYLQTNLKGIQIEHNGSVSFLYGLLERKQNDLDVIKLI